MRSFGYNPTELEIMDMIAEVDDGDGTLGLDEFLFFMAKMIENGDKEEDLKHRFQVFDRDGGGTIEADELRSAITGLADGMTMEEVDEMIREADVDGDGDINYEEFVRMAMAK